MGRELLYREDLPESCPPNQPSIPEEKVLWRLLKAGEVKDADFDSQWKRNPLRKFPDMCRARAISLATSLADCRAMIKSPRMKFTHAVSVAYDASTGVWDQDKPTHVSWWIYSDTDPMRACGNVETLEP